jgi:hypothetical protein
MITKSETALKHELMEVLRSSLPRFVSLRHEDKFSSGHPDISITGNGTTTWIEAKVLDLRVKTRSKGIQQLTMLRLASVSHAFYVVWRYARNGEVSTHIVRPSDIESHSDEWCDFAVGIDYDFVVDRIKELHDVDHD